MNILVLLESPRKIKHVEHTLRDLKDGNKYTVKATLGHISELADVGVYKIGIENYETMEETYIPSLDKKDVINELKKLVKSSDKVWLCSDPDREGEAISWHCVNQLNIPKSKIERICFSEITDKGIKDGIKNKRTVDYNLVDAARTRSLFDKMVGYRISPILWFTTRARSAGRCQSSGLKLLSGLEREIRAFVPEEYYEIKMQIEKNGQIYDCKFIGEIAEKYNKFKEEIDAKNVVDKLNTGEYIVNKIEQKEKTVQPKAPFTTSTIQQTASTTFGMSPKTTMSNLSDLFTDSHITYIRTDSTRLSPEFIEEAKEFIISNFGKDYYFGYREKVKEGAQDAHEAIRCTKLDTVVDDRLYKLITSRSLAALMKPAKVKVTTITIENNGYLFKLSGQVVIDEGFLKVYNVKDEGDEESKTIPEFRENEKIKCHKLEYIKNQTKPPKRYSEAGFIQLLERNGIGRPSTFSSIVETLKDRNYVEVVNKSLNVTDLGLSLDEFLNKHFSDIINVEFTANMEKILDEIADGKKNRVEILAEFYGHLKEVCKKAQNEINEIKQAEKDARVIVGKCPNCSKPMYLRTSTRGEFQACSGYPKCRFTRNADGTDIVKFEYETDNVKCPKCKKSIIVRRENKTSGEKFWACKDWKKCKYTVSDSEYDEAKSNGSSLKYTRKVKRKTTKRKTK